MIYRMQVEISYPALLFRANREKANFLHLFLRTYTIIAIFPSPAWRESLVSDIPAGDGKIAKCKSTAVRDASFKGRLIR
jgi:hypothetical protein